MFQLHVSSAPQLPWLLLLANIAVASLLVCGLTLLVERLWPRRTLPLRHTILLAGLLVTLCAPAIVGLIDAASFSLLEITSQDTASAVASANRASPNGAEMSLPHAVPPIDPNAMAAERQAEQRATLPLPATTATSGSADHAIERALDPPAEPIFTLRHLLWAGLALALVWALGSLVELVRFTLGLLYVRRFLQTVEPVADPRLQRLARAAAQSVGLQHCPPLGQSLAVETPVSVGVLRGQVVLPARQLHEWSDDAWRALLLHEMAHLRRRDLLIGLLQRVAVVLYWWNPLLRRVSAHIAVLREQICDDLVTQHGSQEARYAALIVELAGRVAVHRPFAPVLGAADGTPSELAMRIRRLLDPNRQLATHLSRTMKCAVAAFCVALILGVSGTSIRWASAQENEAAPKNPQLDDVAKKALTALSDAEKLAPLEKKIRIVDRKGRPVAGAKVTPWAIRSATGHGPWSAFGKGRGEPPVVTTDADGAATIPFPRYVEPEEKLPALQLTCRVEHPDFAVSTYNDVPVTPGELEKLATIEVAPGAKVVVQPTADGVTFERDRLFAVWSSPTPNFAVHVTDGGKVELPRLVPGDELMRVVYLPKQGPAMFSEVLAEKLENGREYALTAALQPALSVTGQLDESVPRPVKNGIVIGTVINKASGGQNLHWRVWSPIREDGTFTLGPVPADHLQVIAICDGYMAASGSRPDFADEKLHDSLNYPQVFAVSAAQQAITLKMIPTTECTLQILGPAGKPIQGAKCLSYPNVKWWDSGTQIYCHPLFTSVELLEGMPTAELSRRVMEPSPFEAVTDADGVAVVKNLPPQGHEFIVMHDDLEVPIDGNRRTIHVEPSIKTPQRITVTLQPKGTQHLGDLPAALLEACAAPAAKTNPDKTDQPAKTDAPAVPAPPAGGATTPAKPSEKQVLVLDPDGKPLAGASVTPQSVRVRGTRDWTSFDTLTFKPEPRRSVTTDAKGIARVPLAPQVAEQASAINCQVEHPNFAIVRESDVRLDGSDFAKVSTLRMHRGARLTITPEASGVKFDPAALHVMWTGREEDFDVHVTDAGQIDLPPLPAGWTIYRVIYLPKNGPAMFSEAEEVELVDGQPVQATVAMHPAVRVTGKFDTNVSRPVKNGMVMAQVVNTYNSQRLLKWRVWAKVADDGTFVLEPVPSGDLQVIGMSDGFTAVSTGRNVFQRRPQVFDVSGKEAEITLQMEPAAELEVHVVDESGQPVDNAHCMALPQVNWIGGFAGQNQFYGLPRYSSIDMLKGVTIDERSRMVPNPMPFSGKTDKSGVAVLKDLPPGSNEVTVSGQKMRMLRVELDSGARRAVTVKFDERQTAILGVAPTKPIETP